MRYDSLPTELKTLNQWVCAWTTSKMPMQAAQQKPAQSNNPATWSDYETAYLAVQTGYYDYLGFVFNDNNIVGIDIDAGYDEDGFLSKLSVDCMRACQSYTEKSKSGRGIHILVKGKLPFKGKNNRNGCEIYQTGRYFIMTGKSLVYHELIENQEGIDYIVKKYFSETNNSGIVTGNAIYQPIWDEPSDNGRISLNPQYPPILEGGRNMCLTSLAGSMRHIGYNEEQIYDELLKVNSTACHPPLENDELISILNSILKYDRR